MSYQGCSVLTCETLCHDMMQTRRLVTDAKQVNTLGLALGLSVLRNHKPNKLLFFINFPASKHVDTVTENGQLR